MMSKPPQFSCECMEFSAEQIKALRELFEQDADGKGRLDMNGLRKLLVDFDIDESFAPAMLRVLSGSDKGNGIQFEDMLKFFEVIMSGNLKGFFRQLFKAIDTNGDGSLCSDDLKAFGELINDPLTQQDADLIRDECDMNGDGKVNFDDFWKWYKTQHGLTEPEPDDP